MIIQNKKKELDELGDKILDGINKALRQLVETSAANNKNLVISDGKGNVKSVPARELLKKMSK